MTMKKNLWKAVSASCISFFMIGTFIPYAVKAEDPVSENTTSDQYVEGEAIVLYKKNNYKFLMASPNDNTLNSSNQFVISDEMDFNVSDTNDTNTMFKSSIPATTEKVALVKSSTLSTEQLIDKLKTMNDIEEVVPNYYRQLMAVDTTPDDVLYTNGLQWGMGATAQGGVDYTAALEKDALSQNIKDNIVAVVDTGVDYTNPDLTNVMWINPGNIGLEGKHGYDFGMMDDDPMPGNAIANSEMSHGTHCAGLIAAQTNNGIGIAGAAQHTKIMAFKLTKDNSAILSDLAIYRSYEYIIKAKKAEQNIVAINDSWGAGPYSSILDYVVNQAGKAGMISMMAAGNTGDDVDANIISHNTTELKSPYAIVVGASDHDGKLASFSTYNATKVDLAAPGAAMLSTVVVSNDTYQANYPYNPMISSLTGAEQAQTIRLSTLLNANNTIQEGIPTTEADIGFKVFHITKDAEGNSIYSEIQNQGLFSFGKYTDSTTQKSYLRLSKNQSILSSETDKNIKNYIVVLAWTADNPLSGKSYNDQVQYEYGISALPYTGNQSLQAAVFINRGTNAANAATNVLNNALSGLGACILSISSHEQSNEYILKANDYISVQNRLGYAVSFLFQADADRNINQYIDMDSVGISKTSNVASYGFMSGTSMATPFLAGCLAELASIYPDETPLQLRGRLVGSTVPLTVSNDTKGNEKQVATNGRFTFDKALDDNGSGLNTTINANTWGITNVENRITVHGYALSDATLSVDGKAVAKTTYNPVDDTLTFTADASLFDGKQHRFDVHDASSGMNYQASYEVPEQAGVPTQLNKVGALPVVNDSEATGVLISAADRIFFADTLGNYLYSCTDPAKASDSSAWKKLSAPSNVIEDDLKSTKSLSYTYLNGKLYAFYYDNSSNYKVRYAVYDILTNTWSSSTTIVSLDTSRVENGVTWTITTQIAAVSSEGKIGLLVQGTETAVVNGAAVQHIDNLKLYIKQSDTDVFEKIEIPCDKLMPSAATGSNCSALGYYVKDGIQYVLVMEADTTRIDVLSYDGSSWKLADRLKNQPELTGFTIYDVLGLTNVNAKNGSLLIGSNFAGMTGDTYFTDYVNNQMENLGTIVGTTTVITSASMFNGQMYLSGCSNKNGEIYTLPNALQKKLGSTSVSLSASCNTTGGTAEVEDWRNQPSQDLSICSGDTAVWAAKAEDGYQFVQWEDENGKTVSTEPVYKQMSVIKDVSLKAVFKAVPLYKIIAGANSTFIKDESGNLIITGNGPFNHFKDVKVDNVVLDPVNYSAVSGSTVITLKRSYVDTLSAGTHTIKIEWTDGSAETQFYVETKKQEENPDTGDHTNLQLWIFLMIISGGAASVSFALKHRYN